MWYSGVWHSAGIPSSFTSSGQLSYVMWSIFIEKLRQGTHEVGHMFHKGILKEFYPIIGVDENKSEK